jgi:hypothetical protein
MNSIIYNRMARLVGSGEDWGVYIVSYVLFCLVLLVYVGM